MVKIGVCLSGCGVFDGSEINEAVIALLALDRAEVEVLCMAPDVEFSVIDHVKGEETGERRNVLTESARISRGKITDVAVVRPDSLDALLFPGGFGAAKNLCDFASKGAEAQVHPEVARLVREMHSAGKWIGGICIAPAMLAAVMRDEKIHGSVTVGNDADASSAIESMGVSHVECPVDEFRVDERNRIVTTPAYMYEAGLAQVSVGIERLVGELVERVRGSSTEG